MSNKVNRPVSGASMGSDIDVLKANRTKLTVDLSAIRRNVDFARELHPHSKVMPVIKCNAYGVGAEQIAHDLQKHGVDAFGVENIYEALCLRKSGVTLPIVVLDGCVPENIDAALDEDLIAGIASIELLKEYDKAASKKKKKVKVWLYYNCGLNRSGYSDLDEFSNFVQLSSEMDNVIVECIYSQLSDSHNDFDFTLTQVENYKSAISVAKKVYGEQLETSLYASHGIISKVGNVDSNWIRPGLMLFGENCFSANMSDEIRASALNLIPALNLESRLVHKVKIKEDTTFSYTQHNKVRKGETLGTVSIGYGSGLFPNGGDDYFMYDQTQLPLKNSAIGMDFSQVQIPSGCDIPLYSWVTIFGGKNEHRKSLRDFSISMKISPYALLTSLKVAREYKNGLLNE
ncbi:alanine racemase [Pseudoalteromonas umbrosa]|uniref:alanine racemase n=1 Tax=Pseudoalteromonas umbrosa TaxID=3048489 RepID=UPI0024C39815|nr:alanine racemase [Pseudoalteromonas sp. B95]MDK1288219.1 alanine racemase [Pseudoalteromonas sp. B95]